jgi:hypothetical protein
MICKNPVLSGMLSGMWQLEAKTLGLEVSHAALQLIAEIDEFKGKWEALRTLSPERLLALPTSHRRKRRLFDPD